MSLLKWFDSLWDKKGGTEIGTKDTTLKESTKKYLHNISEPVLSFVECVRKHPSRFDVWSVDHGDERLMIRTVFDKKTNEYFRYAPCDWWFTPSCRGLSDTAWATEEEIQYVIDELTIIYKARKGRKDKLDKLRKERKYRDQRNRLKAIYCEEGV